MATGFPASTGDVLSAAMFNGLVTFTAKVNNPAPVFRKVIAEPTAADVNVESGAIVTSILIVIQLIQIIILINFMAQVHLLVLVVETHQVMAELFHKQMVELVAYLV